RLINSLRQAQGDRVLTELLAWVSQARSPLAQYHAVTALMFEADLITPDSQAAVWKLAVDVMSFPQSDSGDGIHWLVRTELAAYYCALIGCIAAGQTGEWIAAMSWWMAERVAGVFGTNLDG